MIEGSPMQPDEFQYTIAAAQGKGGPDELIRLVNEGMKNGWKPQGGIHTFKNDFGKIVYYQAMIKEQPNE